MCQIPVDLGFLIDGSGSIERLGRGNFGRCIDFVKSLVSFFPVSRSGTHIGAAIYSSKPIPVFGLNRYYTRSAIISAIGRIRYPQGGTRIGRALRFAKKYFFTSSAGRKKVLIVMTDGISKDPVRQAARTLHASGVEVFVLGIGRAVNRLQLGQIATDKKHVFTARFSSLRSVIKAMKEKACLPSHTPSKAHLCL